MIGQHHKLPPYRGNPEWLVEPFRKADWTDLSLGVLRFGMPAKNIKDVKKALPVFVCIMFHKVFEALFSESCRNRFSGAPTRTRTSWEP